MRHRKTFVLALIVTTGVLLAESLNLPGLTQLALTFNPAHFIVAGSTVSLAPSQMLTFLPNLIEEAVLVRNSSMGVWAFPAPPNGSIVRYFVIRNGLFQRQGIQYNVGLPSGPLAVRSVSFLQGSSPDDTVIMLYQVQ